ncbi:MAG: zinc-finger domain-containing protein [Snodgrassella sp.]|jgi:uncharacterized Zn-finger protein|nr:zinc-finger domain-containing protein [Snodgrassella sp.]
MKQTNQPVITITNQDLPLICTGPQHKTWNGHPRVYLPIQSNSTIQCPYCSTQYRLHGSTDQQH